MVAQAGDDAVPPAKRTRPDPANLPKGCIWATETHTVSAAEWQLRTDLAAAYRICHRLGLNEGVCNHLTVLLPGTTDKFLLIAYGLAWIEVTAGNLLTVQATNGKCKDIAYDPNYPGLVEDVTEGDRLAAAMGHNRILLHANHGIIVSGPTIWQAVDDLYYCERAAEIVVKARSMNCPVKYIPEEICSKFKTGHDEIADEVGWQHFHALKRELRTGSDKAFEDRSERLPADVLPGARTQAPQSVEF